MQTGRAFPSLQVKPLWRGLPSAGAATQWLHWVHNSSFRWGSLRRYYVFPNAWCPLAGVPSGGNADTGGHHQTGEHCRGDSFHENQVRHQKPPVVGLRCADQPAGVLLRRRIRARQGQSLPVTLSRVLSLYCCNFSQSPCRFSQRAVAG